MIRLLLSFVLLLTFCGCRTDDDVVQPTETVISGETTGENTSVAGLYVLCEGNMGSNKATLDYLDLSQDTVRYLKNIFPSRNPGQVMQLGDVGNDCQIYGQRLWLVINCSNKVEVCTADSARSLGHVDVPNCRFVAFHEGYAYVSSYVGGVGENSVLGSVYKIDTLTLRVEGRCTVGYQPDELCVVGGKLYVANSGGYNPLMEPPMDYDHTVSVIDLQTFTEERKITVAPNLFRIRADGRGRLWVASRGVSGTPWASRLYMLDGGAVRDSIDTPLSDLAIVGDSLYFLGTSRDDHWNLRLHTGIVDVRTCRMVCDTLLREGSYRLTTPYGLMVHPQTHDLYLMDATNYVSSGRLLCFSPDGTFRWQVVTGDIPGHGCWRWK